GEEKFGIIFSPISAINSSAGREAYFKFSMTWFTPYISNNFKWAFKYSTPDLNPRCRGVGLVSGSSLRSMYNDCINGFQSTLLFFSASFQSCIMGCSFLKSLG